VINHGARCPRAPFPSRNLFRSIHHASIIRMDIIGLVGLVGIASWMGPGSDIAPAETSRPLPLSARRAPLDPVIFTDTIGLHIFGSICCWLCPDFVRTASLLNRHAPWGKPGPQLSRQAIQKLRVHDHSQPPNYLLLQAVSLGEALLCQPSFDGSGRGKSNEPTEATCSSSALGAP
jgi:hypothetical protein